MYGVHMDDDVETIAPGDYGEYLISIDTEVVVKVTKPHPNVTVETLVDTIQWLAAVNGTENPVGNHSLEEDHDVHYYPCSGYKFPVTSHVVEFLVVLQKLD